MQAAPSVSACRHCGAAVEEVAFCCHGCEAAWALVHEAGLEQYYDRRDAFAPRPFDRVREPIAVVEQGGVGIMRFRIDGIKCASCTWLCERVLEQAPGIEQARVSFGTGAAEITLPLDGDPTEALRRVEQLGYIPRPTTSPRKVDSGLMERLGVAAFCAANVMLIAVGVYIGWFSGMADRYEVLFAWTSLVLATPVALWAAEPFYRSSWTALRAGALSMDLPISLAVGGMYLHGVWATVVRVDAYLDSLTVLVALLLAGRLLEQRARGAAADAASVLASEAPPRARREDETEVDAEELELGDRIRVHMGEVLPADGVVVSGAGLVGMALVTGESEPQPVLVGSPVVQGALVHEGSLVVEVQAVGEQTVLGRMALALAEVQNKPIARDSDGPVGAWFVGLALGSATVAGAGWWWVAGVGPAVEVVAAILVVACPCAFALSRPLTVASGIAACARRGLLLRDAQALASLGEIGCVALDKTGTATMGRPVVVGAENPVLRVAAGLCRHSSHPVSQAIVKEAIARDLPLPNAIDVMETPGVGLVGQIDGETHSVERRPAGGGVLVDGHGVIELRDRARTDTGQTVIRLQEMGVDVVLLSGDDSSIARQVAEDVGINEIHAPLLPDEKRQWVQVHPCAFVGDGINDSPALGAAAVGIAMGSGSAASILSADAVLSRESIHPLVIGLWAARDAATTVRRARRFAVAYNLGTVGAAAAGWVDPLVAAILMPLSSAVIITMTTGIDRRLARREASWTS